MNQSLAERFLNLAVNEGADSTQGDIHFLKSFLLAFKSCSKALVYYDIYLPFFQIITEDIVHEWGMGEEACKMESSSFPGTSTEGPTPPLCEQ